MNNTSDHIDELIAMYLAGEALPDQAEFIERWRDESAQNRRYFEHLQLIFEKAALVPDRISFDTDQAWNRVRKKLDPPKPAISIPRNEANPSFLRIAAGVVILIAAGVFAYLLPFNSAVQSGELYAADQTRADTLPDGSEVFLNRETKIEYFFDKRGDTQLAKLSGEAYFSIRDGNTNNFIVQVGEIFIEDIGTSFNVKAYPDSSTIEVVVEEGEVLFYSPNDPGVHLRANGRGTYDKVTGEFSVGEPLPNVTAYKTRLFIFSNHSLETVVKTLNGVYDTQVRIDESIKRCKLTVSFNDEGIDEIVHVIAETLGLSVSKEEGVIWLRGTGCGEAPSE